MKLSLCNFHILRCLKALFAFLLFISSFSLSAQFYSGMQLDFGKNRLQYDDFFWTFYRYEKYDVYFYLGGKELAGFTSEYAAKYLKEIESKLEYETDDKMQIIIYNKLSDFKQSNIGYINNESYNTGGLTRISGNKVFLYFNGSYADFQKQIRAGITEIVFNQMMFGSSITAQMKNNIIFNLPDWYSKGLISYMSENWNTDLDNILKDGFSVGKFQKFNSLTGNDAINAGHSFWRFIAEKYGEKNIPPIIYMTRVSRNIETGFQYVLGMSFKDIISDWIMYYSVKYRENDDNKMPENGTFLKRQKASRIYQHLCSSSDGNHMAYVTNELGQYKVWIYNSEKRKAKRIMKSGFKLDEKADLSYPLLSWHPSGEILAVITEKKGLNYLYLYNLNERKFEKILLQYFSRILDFSYSPNGQLIVMSAIQNGQSDIFVYNMASRSSEQITKDFYDDDYPRFINKGKQIIFSSNRNSDTLRFGENTVKEFNSNKDLFIFDYNPRKSLLRRVTKTPNINEIYPMEYDNASISFISNENGINNRYIATFDSVISHIDTAIHYRYITNYYPVSNYNRNIIEQDISVLGKKMNEIVFSEGIYRMYSNELMPRKNLKKLNPEKTLYFNILEERALKKDSIPKVKSEITVRKKKLRNVYYEDLKNAAGENNESENQYFKQGVIRINENGDSIVESAAFALEKQRNYDVEYSINEVTTQIDFSFLNANYQQFSGGGSPIYLNPGFNFLFKLGLSDLMEDYRIIGGIRFSFNFDNFEYLLSYENLKHRLDRQIIFHRQSLDNYTYTYDSRQYTHSVYYILKWPFNTVMSARGTAYLRNDREVFLSTRDLNNLAKPDIVTNWAGLKGEFIFDNTRNIGLNLYYGTRYKFWGEYYQSIDKENRNLFVLGFDYRNYQKIHKSFIWANRFASSTSFGKNKLIYYMGGVDNWLFPKFNTDINIATDQNYTYQTLATNMRGFTQNIRNGNSFAVINSELRFPVFKYFAKKPIKSDFFNNFQLIGFGDLGTAWTGVSPWDKDNSLFVKNIPGNPISIKLEKEIDPLVGGIGFGLRSRLLGYFMRADWAWGIENGVVKPYVFYFSLNLDF